MEDALLTDYKTPIGMELSQDIVVRGLLGKPSRYYDTYCISLHPSLCSKLGIASKGQCVITGNKRGCEPFEGLVTEELVRDHDYLSACVGLSAVAKESASSKDRKSRTRIRTIATVIANPNLDKKKSEVFIDETLRTAMGIPMDHNENEVTKDFEIRICPLPRRMMRDAKEHISKLFFGYRHIYARVGVAFVADVDKNIGRLPTYAFPLLAVPEGGRIICEVAERDEKSEQYALKKMSVRVYSATPEIQAEREKKEGNERRFRSSKAHLELSNELPRIFVGLEIRKTLNSGDFDVVRLRRSIPYVLVHESATFGINAISTFAAIVAPVFLLFDDRYIRASVVIVATLGAALLTAFRVRGNIK
jgi:hypothetical protein